MTIDIDEARVERGEIRLWQGWTVPTPGGMLLGFVLNLGLAPIIVLVLAGTMIGFSQWSVRTPESV